MKKKMIIGTRSSKLALWQAEYIASCLREKYPDLTVELKYITTIGDKILDAPLAKIGGKGLFTKELETEMLNGEIDIAVHSLKDVPMELPERLDPGDAIVSPQYKTLAALPPGAKVGTSSLRRRAQLLHVRPDLEIHDLRGNVNTRLKKLETENFDAIILAVAGLKRLGFGSYITEVIPRDICLPAVGQGALAIEARADDVVVREMISFLQDEATACAAIAERSFLGAVEGGCQVPVGVFAETDAAGQLRVEAVIASVDGRQLLRGEHSGDPGAAAVLGRELADRLLAQGGREILQQIGLLQDT